MTVSVVVPVLNEEGNIKPLYSELKAAMGKGLLEIIFVDDGSTDNSFEAIKALHKKDRRVKCVRLRKNFGQSAALQAGFDHARGGVVVAIDADLQNDPRDIPKLLEKLDGFDCVSGWRKNRKDSFGKKLFSRIASAIRVPFLGSNVHDFGCTLKAYKAECLRDLNLTGEMHRYIPPLLRWRGFRVTEVPVNHRPRRNGTTKYSYKRIWKGFIDMLNVWFWQKYSSRPLHMFGGLGLVLLLFGVVTGTYSIYMKIFHTMDFSSHFLPTMSFFSFVLGVQFFISGLLADVVLKTYSATGKLKVYYVEEVIK
ncbi:MAG: glycosyltransferase family 2 protein [Candidatus Diapherotrites archaeon]|nr:glycosyltransferase family 2 protein [Candidatus Diapherotrites archaeon]